MSYIIDFEQLKLRVKAAAKTTFENLQDKYCNEVLSGYALCTDDGAMTIYHIAKTHHWTQKEGNAEFEYSPVDWEYSDDDSCFDEAYQLIMMRVERQDDDQYEHHFQEIVDLTFNTFVLALQELKSEKIFPEHIFLSVLSTDPSDHMLRLEHAANKVLNEPILFSKWETWYQQYS